MENVIELKVRYKAARDVFKALIEKAGFPIEDAVSFLNGIQDSDVEPVRHGRWIEIDGQNLPVVKCSVCKRKKTGTKRRYCPHCGAKMDLEEMTNDG